MDTHKNFAYSTVATAPTPASSGTSLVVAAGEGTRFPAVPFNATVWAASSLPIPSNAEIVRVTNIVTDTWTIARAQEGSSARTVVVGDQVAATITAKTLTDSEESNEAAITQTSHGFAVGDVLYYTGSAYAKAKADSAANAEVVGIVSASVTANIFRMITQGKVAGLTGLTAGTTYFLSPSTAGALTATEPATTGQVSKPLLIADSTTSGYFFNMRGSVVGYQAAFVSIYDLTLSADTASFDVQNIPAGYRHLILKLTVRMTGAVTDDVVIMRLNNDSGTNYDWEYQAGLGASAIANGVTADTKVRVSEAPGANATASYAGTCDISLNDYSSTTFFKTFSSFGGRMYSTLETTQNSGLWKSTAAINQITLTPGTGSWKAGSRLTIYGLS